MPWKKDYFFSKKAWIHLCLLSGGKNNNEEVKEATTSLFNVMLHNFNLIKYLAKQELAATFPLGNDFIGHLQIVSIKTNPQICALREV